MLWVVFMGAVASEANVQHRPWYIDLTGQLATHGGLDLGRVKTVLTEYLWWAYVFDEHTQDIWEEACATSELP